MTDSCIGCGGLNFTDSRKYRTKTDHGKAIFHASRLYECNNCHLVQTIPAPSLSNLEEYYRVDYRKGCFAGADVADLAAFPNDNLFYYNRGQSITQLIAAHLPISAPRGCDPLASVRIALTAANCSMS